jgi:hypothetical protein
MFKTIGKVLTLFLLVLPFGMYCQNGTDASVVKVLPGDFAQLIGKWEGTLTYLDYSTNKPYTLPAHLVMNEGRNEFQLKGSHIFPNEPKANSKFRLTLSKTGTQLNKKNVTSRNILHDGQIQITTEYLHKDGNEGKMATNRVTYTIGLDTYRVRKDVQFEGSTEWIMRNEYRYRKK